MQKCKKCGIMIDREAMQLLGVPVAPPWPEQDLCSECFPKFSDIADLSEDERIKVIGHTVTCHKKVVSVVVDSPGNAEIYIRKLIERYPEIEIYEKHPGPIPCTVTFKAGPKS